MAAFWPVLNSSFREKARDDGEERWCTDGGRALIRPRQFSFGQVSVCNSVYQAVSVSEPISRRGGCFNLQPKQFTEVVLPTNCVRLPRCNFGKVKACLFSFSDKLVLSQNVHHNCPRAEQKCTFLDTRPRNVGAGGGGCRTRIFTGAQVILRP